MPQSTQIERQFALPEGAAVRVHHLAGQVRILSGQAGETRILVEQTAGLRWDIEQAEDGTVQVRSSAPKGTKPPEAACTVTLPPGARLRVRLVEGEVRVEHTDMRARMDTVSAAILLEQARGAWHLQTVNGDISADGLEGALYVQTVSGDVRLKGARLSEMQGHAVSGGFEVETALGEGPYEFHTLSGDVVLRLPEDTHCDVDFRTLSGRLEAAFSAVYFPPEGGRRQVMLGEGGAQVRVQTLSGGLWLMSGKG